MFIIIISFVIVVIITIIIIIATRILAMISAILFVGLGLLGLAAFASMAFKIARYVLIVTSVVQLHAGWLPSCVAQWLLDLLACLGCLVQGCLVDKMAHLADWLTCFVLFLLLMMLLLKSWSRYWLVSCLLLAEC